MKEYLISYLKGEIYFEELLSKFFKVYNNIDLSPDIIEFLIKFKKINLQECERLILLLKEEYKICILRDKNDRIIKIY